MPTHQKPERDKEPLHKVATRWLNKNWILINYSILVLIFTGIAIDHLWTVFNDAEQYSRSWVSQKYEERLFYFTTTLISYYYFVDFNKHSPPVLRRPSFASPFLVLVMARHRRIPVYLLILIGVFISSNNNLINITEIRFYYAVAVACCDFYQFTSYGGHTGFVFLYTAFAMTIPATNPTRNIVLRIIIAHQFGSSGLHKLRVGGWQWLHFSTMQVTLQHLLNSPDPFKPHPLVEPKWLKQKWLIQYCLARPLVLKFLTIGGVCFEFFVVISCMYGGYPTMVVVAILGTFFHICTGPLMGIFFPYSIPVYWMTAFSSYTLENLETTATTTTNFDMALMNFFSSTFITSDTIIVTVVICLLSFATWYSLEDWPLNAMVLFPWNAKQQEQIYQHSGSKGKFRFMLSHSNKKDGKSSTINVSEMVSCLWPANLAPSYPVHQRVIRGEKTSNSKVLAKEIVQWLGDTRRFVDNREEIYLYDLLRKDYGGECFDDVVVVKKKSK